MKISTKIRYGLRVMVELARRREGDVVTMKTIAAELGLSRKYLDTICVSLRIAGLVRTRRGPGGEHLLGRDPAKINLGEVPVSYALSRWQGFNWCAAIQMHVLRGFLYLLPDR